MSINPKISNIISGFQNSVFLLKAFSLDSIDEVKSLLKSHNHPVSEQNLKYILKEMQVESPETFYICVYDKSSNHLVGFSNLWYERKYTRGLCTLLHIGQLFVSQNVTSSQLIDIEFLLVDSLTKLGMKLKDCYKSTMHVCQERSAKYKELNYEKSEVHMTLYHYVKPNQNL